MSETIMRQVDEADEPEAVPTFQRKKQLGLAWRALAVVSSLRVTVWLFVFSLLLVFFATMAMMDQGLHTVLQSYFRTWHFVWVPFQIFVRFGQVFLGFPHSWHVAGSLPFFSGWQLGAALMTNLLVAHFTRFRVNWKRSGVLILHTGILVLMVSEFITGEFSIESTMTIPNGSSSNFVELAETRELAFTDSSDPKADDVVAIPGSMLQTGRVLQDPQLPVDVKIDSYMKNADLIRVSDGPTSGPDIVTDDVGDAWKLVPRDEVRGVDGEREDVPSALVTFYKKGTQEALGSHAFSFWFYRNFSEGASFAPQKLTVAGKTYTVELRPQRAYKPYTIHLKQFHHDVYPGTDIPKNFSSQVQVIDPATGENRQVNISMNEPMFYGQETFYQQGFLPGDSGTRLQVVHDPGKVLKGLPLPFGLAGLLDLPYVGCILVALGMLVHFSILLIRFLERNAGAEDYETSTLSRLVPVGCAVLALLGVTVAMTGGSGGDMHLYEFGKTPVQDGGRIKPIDTVARVSLLAISGQQEWSDADGKTQPAIKWLLDVESGGPRGPGLQHKVFRIANEDLLALLGLQRRHGLRYALDEFAPKISDLQREANRVAGIPDNDRSAYERGVDELARHIKLYLGLATQQTPRLFPPAEGNTEQAKWQTFADVDEAAEKVVDSHWDEIVARFLGREGKDAKDADKLTKEEQAKLADLKDGAIAMLRDRFMPAAGPWQDILTAYRAGDAAAFNKALDNYRTKQDRTPERDVRKVGFEAFFNDFSPFYISAILYVVAFVLVCKSWLWGALRGMQWHRPLAQSAAALIAVGLLVHLFGLLGRMYLSDRWLVFVTNLYSSAVFIGFGAAAVGLILEAVFGFGIGAAVGSLLGFAAIMVGGMLVKGEDTLEMMRAVLDTNFWLATHVTCVTLGYTATFLTGFLGAAYILVGVATPVMRRWPRLQRILGQATYGVLCFAVLFSFTGTVLGGVWADQSWGRFWGWDPKENGALLIVLWNALILHARWCGMVKQRGIAVLAVVGNMITAWSWFGTNQLGIGLHAYGFDSGLAWGLTTFWLSQLALIAMGLTPLKYWRSFSPRARLT